MKYMIIGGVACLGFVALAHSMDLRTKAMTCELSQSELFKKRAYGKEMPQQIVEDSQKAASLPVQQSKSEVVFDSSDNVRAFLNSSPSSQEWELLAQQKQQQQYKKKEKSRRTALLLTKKSKKRQGRME